MLGIGKRVAAVGYIEELAAPSRTASSALASMEWVL
jgi:hypothetical protein